jgi:hypothetical protein
MADDVGSRTGLTLSDAFQQPGDLIVRDGRDEGRPQSADSSTAMPRAATLLSDFAESGIARL